MIDKILSLLFPHLCKGCGRRGATLCQRCYFDLSKIQQTRHRQGFYSVGRRTGVLKKLVDDFKFQSERASAKVLANLLDDILPQLPKDTVVVPIPTVSSHVRSRGFDHTALLARCLVRRRGWQWRPLLARRTNTTQHFLTKASQRVQAAKKAFYAPRSPVPPRILLLDDIRTTGASLRAARLLLLKNGAKSVTVAVVCHQDE